MSIIINREVRDNQWSHLADDDPLREGDITVTLGRWLGRDDLRSHRDGRLGVRLLPGDALEALVPHLDHFALVALEFDKFGEGRGYSQAYLLRTRFGYRGEIRALGARRDHVAHMERCGINAFEPAQRESAAALLQGFDEISVRYQPSGDRAPLIFRHRARGASAANQETSV